MLTPCWYATSILQESAPERLYRALRALPYFSSTMVVRFAELAVLFLTAAPLHIITILQESAQERLDRASERTEGAARDTKQQMKQQQGSAGREQDDLGGIGTRVQFASDERGRGDTGGSSSSSGSHEHGKSLGGKIAVSDCGVYAICANCHCDSAAVVACEAELQ
jgi:hypothetical protein